MSGGDGRKGEEGRRGLTLLVAGAFFMENLDGTIISTAAPDMAASFGVRPADIGIAMTAYLVALAGFIPVSGGPPTATAPAGSSPGRSPCSPSPRRSARRSAVCPSWSRCASRRASAGR